MAATTETKTTTIPADPFAAVLAEVQGLRGELAEAKQANYKTAGDDAVTPAKLFAQAKDAKEEGRFGFRSLGEQLVAIKNAAVQRDRAPDQRLLKIGESKAATGLGEAVGPDGGFLLAPTYATGILEIMHEQENLLDRCDQYNINGPSIKIPAFSETSRATGSRRGGVRGYWVDEGSTLTASAPKFRLMELTPHKLAVLAYATEELLADGGQMLEQVVSRGAAEEINFLVGDSILNGTGAGQPLGIMNSPCLVSVSKETGQAAASIVHENVVKMWARCHRSARSNAVWLVNQDIDASLHSMFLGLGLAGTASYLPPGGLSGQPYATLMGRPLVVTEFNQTLGTLGDIVLADMKQYVAVTRGALRADMSMHVQFLTDQLAYRFIFRVGGQPWWNSALTPFKGSATQSPFIALATRA